MTIIQDDAVIPALMNSVTLVSLSALDRTMSLTYFIHTATVIHSKQHLF
jgi:hypothetical protein